LLCRGTVLRPACTGRMWQLSFLDVIPPPKSKRRAADHPWLLSLCLLDCSSPTWIHSQLTIATPSQPMPMPSTLATSLYPSTPSPIPGLLGYIRGTPYQRRLPPINIDLQSRSHQLAPFDPVRSKRVQNVTGGIGNDLTYKSVFSYDLNADRR